MKIFRCLALPLLLIAAPAMGFCASKSSQKFEVTGYVFTRQMPLKPGDVDPAKLTRINYAFSNIQGGRMVLGGPADAQNLAMLAAMRNRNPNLTVLISVGGWLWSTNFSDMALTAESRRVFEESVMEFLRQYDLDGLDIDWEYPGMPGAGHPFRQQDKQNFTALLKELRSRFDAEVRKTGKRLYLTVAMGSSDDVIGNTEMRKVARYVDTVNLMAYDYYEPGSESITGNHAPLFTDPADPKKVSSDDSVRAYEKAGVPAEKILLGVPFYGHEWGEVGEANHGLFQPGKAVPGAYAPFTAIDSNQIGPGFTRYWDETANVPYLYNAEKHIFISYEDPESLRAKCKYVREHKLGGTMFWDYAGDSGKLLSTIDAELGVGTAEGAQ
jgi:chitinase